MKNVVKLCVIVALVSLVVGIISRITLTPFIFGLEANSFLRFTDTTLLFAITLSVVQIVKSKG